MAVGAKFCENCGYQLIQNQPASTAVTTPSAPPAPPGPSKSAGFGADVGSALNKAYNIISTKPAVLLPALIGAVVSAVLSAVATGYFRFANFINLFSVPASIGLLLVGGLLALIGGIVGYIMAFASLDMARNAYTGKSLSLAASVQYVFKRIGTFIVASIVGVILAITVILIPVVILMFVILVVDDVGIGASLSRAFKVIGARFSDMVLLLIIEIIGAYMLGLLPYLGPILVAAFNVLMALAFIDIYFHYRAPVLS